MPLSVLITQCMQRDFVDPLAPQDPLPNQLHIGHQEAGRLLGPDPHTGPFWRLLSWARAQPAERLEIVHLCDAHDPNDPRQAAHLARFGRHCLRGTPGADLAVGLGAPDGAHPNERTIPALTLNDFEGTDLGETLDGFRARLAPGETLRVAVCGVWTDAKVSFLFYDLATRCGLTDLATSSALTASSSRAQHFNALEQLRRLLGVRVFDAVGDLAEWLVPEGGAASAPTLPTGFGCRFETETGEEPELEPADRDVLAYLYRDSARVKVRALGGGFSGAVVLRAESWDALGHQQAPTVAKLGPRALIGKERAAFERVESILGNDAPSIRGYADLGRRAGIQYAYAGMGRGEVTTFKALYESAPPQETIERVLDEVFDDVLGRFSRGATYERMPLLTHYRFRPDLADRVREMVRSVVGDQADEAEVEIAGQRFRNVVSFYRDFLPEHEAAKGAGLADYHYAAFVHGDLNGANILLDARQNAWLIDFFHTERAHVLKDLAKLENDLFFVFTPIGSEAELCQALSLSEALRRLRDLAAPLPPKPPDGVTAPALRRAWATVRQLRRFGAEAVREHRDPTQLSIALLRYAVHTLSFDESSERQKRWALAVACGLAEDIACDARRNRALRIDWIDSRVLSGPGALGLTICPGRQDRGRDLDADLQALREAGASQLYSFLPGPELEWAGVENLRADATRHGLAFCHLPIADQEPPTPAEGEKVAREIAKALAEGERIVLSCLGGLGRSGTVAACVLIAARGLSPEAAVAAVRQARGPRAIETARQERFVVRFGARAAV